MGVPRVDRGLDQPDARPVGMILAAPGGKDFLLGILDECRAVATAEGYPPRAPSWNARQGC